MYSFAAQEFDVATGTDRVKKLTAGLSHMEAEKGHLARQFDGLKVGVASLHAHCCAGRRRSSRRITTFVPANSGLIRCLLCHGRAS